MPQSDAAYKHPSGLFLPAITTFSSDNLVKMQKVFHDLVKKPAEKP